MNEVNSHASNAGDQQLALTQATLDSWGNKIVTWGKKHKGDTNVITYEGDVGYVQWIMARVGSLNPELEDSPTTPSPGDVWKKSHVNMH